MRIYFWPSKSPLSLHRLAIALCQFIAEIARSSKPNGRSEWATNIANLKWSNFVQFSSLSNTMVDVDSGDRLWWHIQKSHMPLTSSHNLSQPPTASYNLTQPLTTSHINMLSIERTSLRWHSHRQNRQTYEVLWTRFQAMPSKPKNSSWMPPSWSKMVQSGWRRNAAMSGEEATRIVASSTLLDEAWWGLTGKASLAGPHWQSFTGRTSLTSIDPVDGRQLLRSVHWIGKGWWKRQANRWSTMRIMKRVAYQRELNGGGSVRVLAGSLLRISDLLEWRGRRAHMVLFTQLIICAISVEFDGNLLAFAWRTRVAPTSAEYGSSTSFCGPLQRLSKSFDFFLRLSGIYRCSRKIRNALVWSNRSALFWPASGNEIAAIPFNYIHEKKSWN